MDHRYGDEKEGEEERNGLVDDGKVIATLEQDSLDGGNLERGTISLVRVEEAIEINLSRSLSLLLSLTMIIGISFDRGNIASGG